MCILPIVPKMSRCIFVKLGKRNPALIIKKWNMSICCFSIIKYFKNTQHFLDALMIFFTRLLIFPSMIGCTKFDIDKIMDFTSEFILFKRKPVVDSSCRLENVQVKQSRSCLMETSITRRNYSSMSLTPLPWARESCATETQACVQNSAGRCRRSHSTSVLGFSIKICKKVLSRLGHSPFPLPLHSTAWEVRMLQLPRGSALLR